MGLSFSAPVTEISCTGKNCYVQVEVDSSTGPGFRQQLAATFHLSMKGSAVLPQRWSYPSKEILTLQPLIDLALFPSAVKLLTLWCNFLIFISDDNDCLESGWLEQSLYFCSGLTLNNEKHWIVVKKNKNSKLACSHLRICYTALTVLQHLLPSHFSISKSQQLQLQDSHSPQSCKPLFPALPLPTSIPSHCIRHELRPNLCPKLCRAEVVTIQAKALSLYNTDCSTHLLNQNMPMNTALWLLYFFLQ